MQKMMRLQLNLKGTIAKAGSISLLMKARFISQYDLKKGKGCKLQSTTRQISVMQQRIMMKIRPLPKAEKRMPAQMIKTASCTVISRKVRKANCILSKTLSLKQVQVSLRNARNNITTTSNAVTMKITIKIGSEFSWNEVVPKKSLSLYMFLSANLQFGGFLFWPIIENNMKQSQDPRSKLRPQGNAAQTKPISPMVCSESMKENTYCDLSNAPATIATKMRTTPRGLGLLYAPLPQYPPNCPRMI